jgi:hypothetical protein
LFSERPIYLRSSGLHGFGTVLEIPTFRTAYEFERKGGSAAPLAISKFESSRPSQAFPTGF